MSGLPLIRVKCWLDEEEDEGVEFGGIVEVVKGKVVFGWQDLPWEGCLADLAILGKSRGSFLLLGR